MVIKVDEGQGFETHPGSNDGARISQEDPDEYGSQPEVENDVQTEDRNSQADEEDRIQARFSPPPEISQEVNLE